MKSDNTTCPKHGKCQVLPNGENVWRFVHRDFCHVCKIEELGSELSRAEEKEQAWENEANAAIKVRGENKKLNAELSDALAMIERVRGLERYECSSAGRFYVSASDLDAEINPKAGEGDQ